jgi:UDP-N-acetyl-D-mannosaminuronate dehydrogenase
VAEALGGLDGAPVLVLGLTYRENVNELAYSQALPLIQELADRGAAVYAYDPLLSADEITRRGARPYVWGQAAPFRAVFTQTGDALWRSIDFSLFPELRVLLDGRNSVRAVDLPAAVRYIGIGVQAATRRRAALPS